VKHKQFLRDRREALLSMDKNKILDYCRKYGVPIPADENVLWVGIHKARCEALDISQEERQKSADWLINRGIYPGGMQKESV
jgi:hypothetical protein